VDSSAPCRCRESLGRHVGDAVRVDVEGDLDLRHAARRRGRPTRWNLPSARLSRASDSLALEHVDFALVWLSDAVEKILALRVGIVVLRGMRVVFTPPIVSIPRRHGVTVEQQQVLDLARRGTPACTDSADRHHFVRVDALVRLAG